MRARVVAITGASGGIGMATAYSLGRFASQLFLVGRSVERLRAVSGDLRASPLVTDITNPNDVRQMAEAIDRKAGRLDVLVNCAGQLEVGRADELGLETTERLLRVNYLGAVATIHACLPLLRKGQEPVIVNVSSVAGKLAPPFMAAYAASKFALNGYTHALRQELGPEGIHVGLVLPGPVNTPMIRGRLGGVYYPLPPGVPTVEPEQVAEAILALIKRRMPEIIVPQRLSAPARLGSAFPRLVDRVYARIHRMAAAPGR